MPVRTEIRRPGLCPVDVPELRRFSFVNVVFLLLTATAGLGSHPSPTPCPSCCSEGSCGAVTSHCASDCCSKPGLFDRFRGLFGHKCDCCEPTPCCTPAPVCCPAPQPCCKPKPTPCCTPAPVCCHAPQPCCKPQPTPCCGAVTTCGCECHQDCGKPGLFARLRGMFRKCDDCCHEPAPCCDTGCGSSVIAPIPATQSHAAPSHIPAPGQTPGQSQAPGHAYKQPFQLPAGKPLPVQKHNPTVITPTAPGAPSQGAPIQNSPIPDVKAGKPKVEKEGARLMIKPVVQPAAAKIETTTKNPF